MTSVGSTMAGFRRCGVTCHTRRRPRRPVRILLRASILALLTIVLSGTSHAVFHPARDESQETSRLVESLIDGRGAAELVPEDFRDRLGYQPVDVAGTLIRPTGGCSTPGEAGPEEFRDACRTHDLGYDALRYAESTGSRLGAWARFDLDRRLYTDLLQTCRTMTCRTTATAYYTAVTANSIRQGYVAPTAEPTAPWVGIAVTLLAVAFVEPDDLRSVRSRPAWRRRARRLRDVASCASPHPGHDPARTLCRPRWGGVLG